MWEAESQLQGEKGRTGQLATWEGSQVSGRSPVIAIFVRGLHISGSCKLLPQSIPLICPGDQKIEQRLWVGRVWTYLPLSELTLG